MSSRCLVAVAMAAVLAASVPAEAQRTIGLAEAFRAAQENNSDIRIAAEGLEQGRILQKQAITVLFPRLTAVAGYGWQSYSDGTEADGTNYGLSLTQTLYNGGRVWIAKRGAEYTYQAALMGLEYARQSVLMDLVAQSNALLAAEDLLKVNKARVQRLGEQLRSAEARLEVGDVPRTEVLSVKVALSDAQRELVVAQARVDLAATRLASLMRSDEKVRVLVPEEVALPTDLALEDLQERAIRDRSDLAQGRELVRISREESNLTARNGHPNVDLSGSVMRYSEDSPFTPETQVALTLTWPFFQGGLVSLQTKEALSRVRQAEEGYAKLVEAARLQVEEALLDLETLRAQESLVRSNLEDAREKARLAQSRFALGAAVSLDLLDAEESLIKAENLAVSLSFDTRTARAALLYSIGALDLQSFGSGQQAGRPTP